jgi:hypothetical protein
MSTSNIPGGKALPARKADNLTAISEPIALNGRGCLYGFQRLKTIEASTAFKSNSFTFRSKNGKGVEGSGCCLN